MAQRDNLHDLGSGTDTVLCFIDDDFSAVMTKVVSARVDPFELMPDEARRLASALIDLAERLDAHDSV